ncbi:MFS transporter [Rhizorhabdus argentea]|uniref:MFS transporter n=1 Tax=Rhizorhabdus argentea TaxID=1387174 RepID=UPI003BF52B46
MTGYLHRLSGFAFARWVDSGNRGNLLTASLCVWSAATALCGLATVYFQLAVGRLIVGFSEGGHNPGAHGLICDSYLPKRRTSPVGVQVSGASVFYCVRHLWRRASER